MVEPLTSFPYDTPVLRGGEVDGDGGLMEVFRARRYPRE